MKTAPTAASESVLQKRYDAAQKFQSQGDLTNAATQYGIFIADALGEAALGRAEALQYERAEADFDEALRLVPDFPMLQLEYARVCYRAAQYEHTRLLANDLLQRYPANEKLQAEAHALLGRAYLKLYKDAEAKQQFEAAVAINPTFDNGYELAIADLDLGDIEGTRKIFKEMLTSFGDKATIHMYFGQAYGNSDFQSDAVAEFEKALSEDPRLPGVHYSLAVAYLATAGDSKLAEAEDAIRKEIEISPQNAQPYAALGHLLATHGQTPEEFAQAETDLKKAVALAPANPDAYLYLGQFYADRGRVPEAEAALRQSIALTTDVSRNAFQVQKAHYLLARLLRESGDQDGAAREFQLSQSLLKQNLSRDQQQLAGYLQEKPRGNATTEFRQPMSAVPDDSAQEARSTAAVDAFERRVAPAIADSYNNLGAIAAGRNDLQLALTDFQHAAEWAPSLPGLDYNWGRAAFEAGDYAQAIGPLQRYLLQHPQEDGARRVLGLSQFMEKRYDAARATLQPLAQRADEAPQIRFAYADSLLQTGDAPQAITQLEALVQLSPPLAQVQPTLSKAYAQLGREQVADGHAKDAVQSFQHALKLDPKNASLKESLAQANQLATKH